MTDRVPGGFPSWSRHFQSSPLITLAPTTIWRNTWLRIKRRWRRTEASASRAARPGGVHVSIVHLALLCFSNLHIIDILVHRFTEHFSQNDNITTHLIGRRRPPWRCRKFRIRWSTSNAFVRRRSSRSVWCECGASLESLSRPRRQERFSAPEAMKP